MLLSMMRLAMLPLRRRLLLLLRLSCIRLLLLVVVPLRVFLSFLLVVP